MDVAGVAEAMNRLGIEHVHLAVRPALEENGNEYLNVVRQQDWTISSTMIAFPQEDYSTSFRMNIGSRTASCSRAPWR
jgi:hypothetical protein